MNATRTLEVYLDNEPTQGPARVGLRGQAAAFNAQRL